MLITPLVFMLGFMALQAIGQNAGDYRSNPPFGTGAWNAANSWERFNGTSWATALAPPTSADGVITIRNTHRIDLTTATTIDQVVVASGGQLVIFNLVTPFVATLANGVGNDIEVNGTLIVGLGATLSGAGNIVNNSGGTFIVRNTAVISVTAVNNGTMQVSGTGTFQNTTVTNNATFNLIDFTLNLNNATFINRGLVTFDSILDSYISGTGGGVFINEADGTLHRASITGAAWIDPTPGTVAFTNRGTVRGTGIYIFRSNVSNAGFITPGNNGAGIIEMNPAFVTGKTPTFNMEIVSSGFIAGVNYDRVIFSNYDAATVNISGSTLNVSDNASDAVNTIYTIFQSTSTIAGTFPVVHLAPTLGNLTYNATSITVQKIATQIRYVWVGGATGAWGTAANWSPARNTPAATDVLTFNTGTTVTITDVPAESISALNITNNTTVNLQAATASKNLTIGNGYMNYLNVDPGSTLNVLPNGLILLNIFIAGSNSRAVIGGVVNMQNGTFNVGDNVLQLHTNASPLQRVSGQFAIGSGASIEFGDPLHTSGPPIVLPSSIFVAPPVVASITVCRTNGAVFGNQSITVNQANMILGNLTTNAGAKIIFSTTALNPAETPTSKIIGVAEMMPRAIGTGAFNFLGVVSAAGSNIGTVSLTRTTGPDGINSFNGFTSIASSWNITATTEPSPARSVSFSWFSEFDNTANTSLLFQDYRFDVGPGWVAVGALAALQSAGNPRVTTATLTLKFTGIWSISDQANVLPIVLGELSAKQVDENVVLDWNTLSELNGDYFEIQRRGQYEEGFTSLGTVSAHGTTNDEQFYTFIDQRPLKGLNYYRLKLVDFDQTFEYSSIVAVQFKPDGQFSIYPNPSNGKQVTIQFAEAVNGKITVFDMAQRKVMTLTLDGTPADEVVLSDLALAAGAYLISFETTGQRIVKRLLVKP